MASEPERVTGKRSEEKTKGSEPEAKTPEATTPRAKATEPKASEAKALLPARRIPHSDELLLLDSVLRQRVRLPRRLSDERQFVRLFYRAASSPQFLERIIELRDSVIRSVVKGGERDGDRGVTIALTGVKGSEGASAVSLLLSLALGGSTHYRVAFLDGRLSVKRFDVLARVLELSKNSCRLTKGANEVYGYFNETQANVYFLKPGGAERGLEFFSDRELKGFFAGLREEFDFTVIDMPPLLRESSNVYVAPAVDRLYLVVAAGSTRLADVDRGIEVAEEMGAKVAGVIVNHQKAPFWTRLFAREYFF
jgi:Mrp family chromosome partitioning ATPase